MPSTPKDFAPVLQKTGGTCGSERWAVGRGRDLGDSGVPEGLIDWLEK